MHDKYRQVDIKDKNVPRLLSVEREREREREYTYKICSSRIEFEDQKVCFRFLSGWYMRSRFHSDTR